VPGKGNYTVDEENTDRLVAHSLQNLFNYGKIFIYDVPNQQPAQQTTNFEPNSAPAVTKDIFLRPDLRMFDPYCTAILKIIPKYIDPNDPSEDSHQIQMRNLLKNAIFKFYQAGHQHEAQRIYNSTRILFPFRPELQNPSVEVFVRQYMKEQVSNLTINNAVGMVILMLREAYFRYAIRDDDESYAREKLAEEAYQIYISKYSDEDRLSIPDFKILRYNAINDFFNDQEYPVALRQNLIARIKIERPDLAEQFVQMELKMIEEAKKSEGQPQDQQ
jgi:hypothetical protein